MALERPAAYVPLSVRFATGGTGQAIIKRFGAEGLGVWAAYLAACKRERPEGQITYASELEALNKLGLDIHRPSFTLHDFFVYTGRLKKTRTRRVSGQVMETTCTAWRRWTDTDRRERDKLRKSRKRAETDADTVRNLNGRNPDLELELELEVEEDPPTPLEGGPPASTSRRTTDDRRASRFVANLTPSHRELWDELGPTDHLDILNAYRSATGIKFVRGTHGYSYKLDPLGADPKPTGYEANQIPHGYTGKPKPDEFFDAYQERVLFA